MIEKLLRSSIYAILAATLAAGVAAADMNLAEQTKMIEEAPINCATAKGDLRVLAAEREHAEKTKVQGIMAITPTGILFGVLTGTQEKHMEILTGDYIKHIDHKLALINAQCGAQL